MVYIVLFLHGIGALIAIYILVNANSYFVDYKLNVRYYYSETLENYRKNFLSYLGIASKAPNILFQFINMFFSSESLSTRIWASLLFQSVIFGLILAFSATDTSRWPEVYFWLIMSGAFVANIANGIFQSCVYGIAAKLPVRYTNGVTIGFNLSGVIAAVFMIVSISVAQNDRVVAIYLFSFAIAYQMLCFLAELLVRRNANIKPVGRIIADKYFSPIFCFLLFPVFNTIGNYLAEVSAKPSETLLTVLSLLRLSFIPFFLLCNYYPYDRHMSVLVANDWVYITGAISMAVTSGYLSSICIMYCPVGVEPRLYFFIMLSVGHKTGHYLYFVDYKLNVTDHKSETLENYRKNFLSYLGIASKAPNILFQFINMFFSSDYQSLSIRICVSLLMQTIVFVVTLALAVVDSSQWPELFFWITMLSAVVINTANGVFQGCVYGIAAKLPVRYTNAVTIGFNLSGVIAALLLILSIAIAPTARVVAIYFFTFAVVYLVFCLCNELFVRQNKYYLFVMNASNDGNNCYANYSMDAITKSMDSIALDSRLQQPAPQPIADNNELKLLNKPPTGYRLYGHVFRQIWPQLLNIIIIYFVTFSIFPAVEANIKPVDSIIADKYFAPVFCFLIFPLFKTIGNSMADWLPKPAPNRIVIYSIARCAFVPFFLLCNYLPHDRHVSVLIHSDWAFVLGAALMALTSGYLSSLCIMYCPVSVEPRHASIASMMASFTILFGILLGLNFSLVYPWIVNM
ncbi:unnamed protein product [Medioppia subpectinata]|uniref:Equilibrative nucleoside transporter n=1 Tax=Medioppia subpectinata TaxID=1979941 RepID=A0A7R9Q002_9ACAR|nr:unnamed protein product [Medioppia subpectinata]CAG2107518.1 unnamed protein product [Medioppia subpectinata]